MAETETLDIFKPTNSISSRAYVKNMEEYKKMYEESIKNREMY